MVAAVMGRSECFLLTFLFLISKEILLSLVMACSAPTLEYGKRLLFVCRRRKLKTARHVLLRLLPPTAACANVYSQSSSSRSKTLFSRFIFLFGIALVYWDYQVYRCFQRQILDALNFSRAVLKTKSC